MAINDEFDFETAETPELKSVLTVVKSLLLNPQYVFCVIPMTNMMFIVTALQYWASDYMISVLNADPEEVYIVFMITILSAPLSGAIISGIITTKIGGYTNKKALVMCLIVESALVLACIPATFLNTVEPFLACLWLMIFTQSFMEPVLTGILLNTVKAPERATASSLSIFIEMIFGLMPAPFVYGSIA